MKRHLLLIGLPGSGKTTTGRLAAERLGAPFLDGDELVETRVGRPVARIIADEGEARFRELERETVAAALSGPAAVIAPGGGWAAQPGNLETAGDALVVHLEVSTTVALARMGATDRPLLAGDPAAAMARLQAERFPLYRRAEATVRTDPIGVSEVAELLAQLARSRGGW